MSQIFPLPAERCTPKAITNEQKSCEWTILGLIQQITLLLQFHILSLSTTGAHNLLTTVIEVLFLFAYSLSFPNVFPSLRCDICLFNFRVLQGLFSFWI